MQKKGFDYGKWNRDITACLNSFTIFAGFMMNAKFRESFRQNSTASKKQQQQRKEDIKP
jgi:hypothetical protein